jgi:hypothetical protein
MDCISVQDAFSIMNGSYTWTGKDGVWECHGKVIHFIPAFNVEIGENYVIRVEDSAIDIFGMNSIQLIFLRKIQVSITQPIR